ncbi:MAG: hypothetical protein ACRDGV_00815 [Candidatus Limnocylindria bacterium]
MRAPSLVSSQRPRQLSFNLTEPKRPSRLPGPLRTIPIALVLCVMAFASTRVEAASPELSVIMAAVPGGAVVAAGEGFAPNAHIELRWNGSSQGMAVVIADSAGRFETVVTVPADAEEGSYELTAVEHSSDSGEPREATVTVRVLELPVAVEPDPTPVLADPTTTDLGGGPELTVPAPQLPSEEPTPAPTTVAAPAPAPVVTTGEPTAQPTPEQHEESATAQQPGHAAGSGNPVTCTGYPEPRTFLQIHTWWEGDPLAEGQIAHLHAASCVPLGQTVSGVVTFDTLITLHDNPGHLFRYETALFTNHAGQGNLHAVGMDETCGTGRTCEYWVRTRVDTTKANDGWHELRFKPRVELSNGEVMLTSSGWPIRTENGNSDGGQRDGIGGIVGRGWYTDNGYQNPVLQSLTGVLPGQTVSGVWQPQVRLDAGSGGGQTTFSAAYIGPDFHHNDEDSDGGGIVLGQWNSEFRGSLRIDTTTMANGLHTLVLRVDAVDGGKRLTGLQYVDFVVAN